MEPPRLHLDVDGTGPALVLAHGFGGSARNFGPQMRALKDRYRVVRYDARGHGRSDAPAELEAYTPATFVGDMGRVLDEAGTPTAVVGGLSMGAGIALRFAMAQAARVRGLVLCAFPPVPTIRRASRPRHCASPRPSSARASRRPARRTCGGQRRGSIGTR